MADSRMPQEMIDWMTRLNWGTRHVHWHIVRIWDLVSGPTRSWASDQGWSRAPIQEGESGNGLSFLAMHRAMIRALRNNFPQHTNLMAGWAEPPTDPQDADDPLPHGAITPFSQNMADAVDRLHNNIDSFPDDDEFGIYIETSLSPTPGNPGNRSVDRSTGIHNYLHGRFQDNTSDVDMGDPTVNIFNQRFWRLHGWIDTRWSGYRLAKGFLETDQDYVDALDSGEQHMGVSSAPHALEHAGMNFNLEVPEEVKQDLMRALSERIGG